MKRRALAHLFALALASGAFADDFPKVIDTETDKTPVMPADQAASLEYELFPGLIGVGGLYGFPCNGFFVDIGVPSEFLAVQRQPARLLAAVGLKEAAPGAI